MMELSPETLAHLEHDRDACADQLRKLSAETAGKSALDYLADGVSMMSSCDVLAGRMAKAGVTYIEYRHDKPGWRITEHNYERYVSEDEVRSILEGRR